MNSIKILMTVSMLVAATSANAMWMSFVGTLDSIIQLDTRSNTLQGTVVLGPQAATYVYTTINKRVPLPYAWFNVAGGIITAGQMEIGPYGMQINVGPNYGATANIESAVYTFGTHTAAGFSQSGGAVDDCFGTVQGLICPPLQYGSPAIDYILTHTGGYTWNLKLRYGSLSNFVTVQNYSLKQCFDNYDCILPVEGVPLPAGAWLFGSGLLGLAGAMRKRKAMQ
jgi:hypothetical protein